MKNTIFLSRLTSQTQQVGTSETWSFGYGYDALGRCNMVTYPSGSILTDQVVTYTTFDKVI